MESDLDWRRRIEIVVAGGFGLRYLVSAMAVQPWDNRALSLFRGGVAVAAAAFMMFAKEKPVSERDPSLLRTLKYPCGCGRKIFKKPRRPVHIYCGKSSCPFDPKGRHRNAKGRNK